MIDKREVNDRDIEKFPGTWHENARFNHSFVFFGDYLMLELDKDYRLGAIGSCSDKYLWIF